MHTWTHSPSSIHNFAVRCGQRLPPKDRRWQKSCRSNVMSYGTAHLFIRVVKRVISSTITNVVNWTSQWNEVHLTLRTKLLENGQRDKLFLGHSRATQDRSIAFELIHFFFISNPRLTCRCSWKRKVLLLPLTLWAYVGFHCRCSFGQMVRVLIQIAF